jgi:hypothetical protein
MEIITKSTDEITIEMIRDKLRKMTKSCKKFKGGADCLLIHYSSSNIRSVDPERFSFEKMKTVLRNRNYYEIDKIVALAKICRYKDDIRKTKIYIEKKDKQKLKTLSEKELKEQLHERKSKIKICFEKKKKSMKITKSRKFFSCHISQHFDKRKVYSTLK